MGHLFSGMSNVTSWCTIVSQRDAWGLCRRRPGCREPFQTQTSGSGHSHVLRRTKDSTEGYSSVRERCFSAWLWQELKTTAQCSAPQGGDAIKCHPMQWPLLQPGTETLLQTRRNEFIFRKEEEKEEEEKEKKRKSACCSGGDIKYLERQNTALFRT